MLWYGKLPILLLTELASGEWDSPNSRIAEWLLEHLNREDDVTMEQIASECFVSNSAVSRFCRSIGLEDFKELRRLWQENRQSFTLYGEGLPAKEQAGEFLRRIQEEERLAVESLDYSALDELAKKICTAKRVVLLGLLRSANVAMNLQSNLCALGIRTASRLTYREQANYLKAPPEDDLILILSFSGTYFEYGLPREFLRNSKQVWLLTGCKAAAEHYPNVHTLSFHSQLNFAGHPYQLQAVAGVLAQRCGEIVGQ